MAQTTQTAATASAITSVSHNHESSYNILIRSPYLSLANWKLLFIYTPSSNPDLSLYFRPRCGFGFFSKSDFSAIFFSHFFSSSDSFFKFNLSRLQINAKDACSGSPSSLAASSAACKNPFSGLSSGTLKNRPCGLPAGQGLSCLYPAVSRSGKNCPRQCGR